MPATRAHHVTTTILIMTACLLFAVLTVRIGSNRPAPVVPVPGTVRVTYGTAPVPVSVVRATDPEEDSPEFDCRLHGNRVCGPVVTD